MKMISELYHGNINPSTKSVVQGSDYQKYQYEFCDTIEELEKMLNENEKQLLEKLTNAWINLIPLVVKKALPKALSLGQE